MSIFQSGKKDRLLTLLPPSQGLSVISVQIYINEIDIPINQTWKWKCKYASSFKVALIKKDELNYDKHSVNFFN